MSTFSSSKGVKKSVCAVALVGSLMFTSAPAFSAPSPNTQAAALPAAGQAPAQNDTPAAVSGTINWGIKASFRSYIGEPYAVGEGASYNTKDLFSFPAHHAVVSNDGNQVSLQGSGKVHYISHCTDRNNPETGCALNLTLSNPRIEFDAVKGSGTLYMTVRTKNYASGQWEGPHEIPVAALSLLTAQQQENNGVVTWTNVAANLTPEGNHAFSNFYSDGEGLDALTFSYAGKSAQGFTGSGYRLGQSWDSGADIADPQNTVRVGSYLFHASGARFGSDEQARYSVLEADTLREVSSGTLPMGKSARFAANPDSGEIIFAHESAGTVERYAVNEQGELVSRGAVAGLSLAKGENVMALGYNGASKTWGVLAVTGSAQARFISVDSNGAVTVQKADSPKDYDTAISAVNDVSEYYGDTFTGDTRTLAALPDGSFVYAPNKVIRDAADKQVQGGQLLHLSTKGFSVAAGSTDDATAKAYMNGLMTTPDGYVYRWNNYAPAVSAVQVLAYDGSSFRTVRATAKAPQGIGELASLLSAGDKIVAVDAANGRLVWLSKDLSVEKELPLTGLKKTDKTASANALELPNGDIIYPTMLEKNDGLSTNLWLNRLVKSTPNQPRSEDPQKPQEPQPQPQRFSDVPATDQFYSEVQWLGSQNITTGYPDGTFRPGQNVERAAMAAYFYRMAGSPEVTVPKESPFKDVDPSFPFYKEIVWMHQRGITTGYWDGTFRPHDPVNRDAMAAFFYRYAGAPAYTAPVNSPFNDVRPGTMFYREITWLAAKGVTKGWSDGTYRPGEPIHRDAMAAFIYRYRHQG